MTETDKQAIINSIVSSATDLASVEATTDVDFFVALKGNLPKRVSKSTLSTTADLNTAKAEFTSKLETALTAKQGNLTTDTNLKLENNKLSLTQATKRAAFITMWKEAGGDYDEGKDNGQDDCPCFKMNGVAISAAQAVKTYRLGACRGGDEAYGAESIYTNIPRTSLAVAQDNFLRYCGVLQVANIAQIKLGKNSFGGSKELTTIFSGTPKGESFNENDEKNKNNFGSLDHTAQTGNPKSFFLEKCGNLKVVKIKLTNSGTGGDLTLDLRDSPYVEEESLHWIIKMAQLTNSNGATTHIIVHDNVYENYLANPYQGDTANHPINICKPSIHPAS